MEGWKPLGYNKYVESGNFIYPSVSVKFISINSIEWFLEVVRNKNKK